jgi:hypothetical protein
LPRCKGANDGIAQLGDGDAGHGAFGDEIRHRLVPFDVDDVGAEADAEFQVGGGR